jgi:hypothetical protein
MRNTYLNVESEGGSVRNDVSIQPQIGFRTETMFLFSRKLDSEQKQCFYSAANWIPTRNNVSIQPQIGFRLETMFLFSRKLDSEQKQCFYSAANWIPTRYNVSIQPQIGFRLDTKYLVSCKPDSEHFRRKSLADGWILNISDGKVQAGASFRTSATVLPPLGVGSSLRRIEGKAPALRLSSPIFATHRDDAVRRPIWITPCKRSAARGIVTPLSENCVAVQPATGLRRDICATPSYAFGLHGVIQIGCLPASARCEVETQERKAGALPFIRRRLEPTPSGKVEIGTVSPKGLIFITVGQRPTVTKR